MTFEHLAPLRLQIQHLTKPATTPPGEVVRRLGAVQAQDYRGALWALGLRTSGVDEGAVEQALADRSIVRTWPMRGTLHMVASDDVRWMLDLLTPRILARSRGRYRQLGLDDTTLARAGDLLTRTLEGGRSLTRVGVYETLDAGGISPEGQRGIHIIGHLAQKGLLCFGAPDGNQQTFVLLDEWIPSSRSLGRDEALAEAARRYFAGHGPATLDDFVWWTGLTKTDARAALDRAAPHLSRQTIDGTAYWLASDAPIDALIAALPPSDESSLAAYLLPMYDEYTVGYKDRSAALDPARADEAGNGIFRPIIILRGRVVGTWKRTLKKDTIALTTHLFETLTPAERRALDGAMDRYGAFMGRSVA